MRKLIFIVCWLPQLAFAWGEEGHRIIGAIADQHISQLTRTKLNWFFSDTTTIASLGNWLDEMRPVWDGARPFHYLSMPPDATKYEPAHCENDGICAVSMLEKYTARLQSRLESPHAKAEAIKVIIHLLQDVHMPLHTGGKKGDYGGNAVKVWYNGKKTNLHAYYDYGIIQAVGWTDEQWVTHLTQGLTPEKVAQLQQGTYLQWIEESHQHVPMLYKQLPGKKREGRLVLGETYTAYARPVMEQQLLAAGLRLAKYLELAMEHVVRDKGMDK